MSDSKKHMFYLTAVAILINMMLYQILMTWMRPLFAVIISTVFAIAVAALWLHYVSAKKGESCK